MGKFYAKIVAMLMALFALTPAFADEAAEGAGQELNGFVFGVSIHVDSPKYGFVKFNTSDITKVDLLKKVSMWDPMVTAGEYLDGKVYAYTVTWDLDYGGYSSDSYVVYDAATYNKLSTKSYSGRRVLDMTYDYTTNTMYALAEDKVSSAETTGKSSLYIVDLATGNLTHVGDPGELKARDGYNREVDNSLVTLAADKDGNLYAMSEYRYFFKIDKYTGKATQVGERHNLAVNNQFQSMTFGNDGVLYWAQKTPDYGWLTVIDPATGTVDKKGTIADDYQITGLWVKHDFSNTFPCAVTDLKAENDAVDHNKVTLSWTLPTTDAAGNPTTLKEVRVYRFGTETPVAVLPADATSYVDESAPNGFSTYQVVAVNDAAPGTPAMVEVFAGYDQLKGVNDVVTKRDGTNVSLSWSKPTETVNGKWTDYDNITYNVYRVDLQSGNYIRVAENQTATTYYEELPGPGTYTYVIEAVSGGVVGLGARSNVIVYAPTYTIPYSTGFEDAQDGLYWTAVNNPAKYYGWSITKSSYGALDGKYAQFKSGSGNLDAWLVSPAISFEKGDYTLQYSADGGSIDTHDWEIALGLTQDNPESFKLVIDRHEGLKVNGWANNTFKADFTVPADGVFYLGLHGFTKVTYATLKIDNLSITPASPTGIGSVKAAEGKISVNGGVAVIDAVSAVKSWTLTGIGGQAVMNGEGNGSAHVEVGLSAIPAGLYVMTVKTADGGALVKKIVVGK